MMENPIYSLCEQIPNARPEEAIEDCIEDIMVYLVSNLITHIQVDHKTTKHTLTRHTSTRAVAEVRRQSL